MPTDGVWFIRKREFDAWNFPRCEEPTNRFFSANNGDSQGFDLGVSQYLQWLGRLGGW